MGIIIISRGSYTHGKEVAEKVAKKLNYKIIAREELYEFASREWGIPSNILVHAIEDVPSFWDRMR